MTQEDKDLLLKDLRARLPYGVYIHHKNFPKANLKLSAVFSDGRIGIKQNEIDLTPTSINECKPYLRPISSMTEEERDEIEEISHGWFYVNEDGEIFPVGQLTDSGEFEGAILPTLEWLNKKMFDYRGLIPMGLALEATEGMYEKF